MVCDLNSTWLLSGNLPSVEGGNQELSAVVLSRYGLLSLIYAALDLPSHIYQPYIPPKPASLSDTSVGISHNSPWAIQFFHLYGVPSHKLFPRSVFFLVLAVTCLTGNFGTSIDHS